VRGCNIFYLIAIIACTLAGDSFAKHRLFKWQLENMKLMQSWWLI